jgi:enamine deaminase RidA (YjgF/YER057c/UK114 family)
VKVSCYLADGAYLTDFTELYARWLGDSTAPTGLTQITALPAQARVLLDAVARRPGEPTDLVFATASADRAATQTADGYSIGAETSDCLRVLTAALARDGASLASLLKVNCYLADDGDRGEFLGDLGRDLRRGRR